MKNLRPTVTVLAFLLTLQSQSWSQPTPLSVAQAAFRPIVTRLSALSASAFLLQWEAPDEGVTSVRIYRDGQLVATLPGASREFRDDGLKAATVYSYSVATLRGDEEIRSRLVSDTTRLPNEGKRITREKFDIVVAGATPGGIAAALTAARFGDKVALLSPSLWIGGMMTGGLTRTDFGSMKSSGGIFKEFVDRTLRFYTATYGAGSLQVKACREGYYFEPRVAKWIFHQMLAEQPNLTLFLDHHSRDVVKQGSRVTEIYVLDKPRMIRKIFAAQVFIDATYEGDLAAQTGAAYRIGRESKDEFGEAHAGELFWEPTAREVKFGSGKGDRKVQAYNYRLCLTTQPDNVQPVALPASYDRNRYVTLIPDIKTGRVKSMEQALSILPLPNDKFDANNHPLGNPSSDLIGGADNYPESDVWAREPIIEAHRLYVLGLLYFLQNDSEVPEKFREAARRWGLAADEFVDNEHFPTQLYVREGRRIVGPYIFTENDARSAMPERRPTAQADSIAVADYPVDSHATTNEKNGLLEGFFYLPGSQTQPSQVPYRTLTPEGIEGVIVSVCVSCTHIGYGTLRMEPVFMSLGTAAGLAAHLSVANRVAPSQLNVEVLQRGLLAQGHVICVFNDVPPEHPQWAALEYFGTKGFFPKYEAKPDDFITRAQAAQWLWQWMQAQKSDLRSVVNERCADVPAYHAAYLAVCSLHHLKIIGDADTFRPDDVVTAEESRIWLKQATMALGWKSATFGGDSQRLTRGQFCQRLYEAETGKPVMPPTRR